QIDCLLCLGTRIAGGDTATLGIGAAMLNNTTGSDPSICARTTSGISVSSMASAYVSGNTVTTCMLPSCCTPTLAFSAGISAGWAPGGTLIAAPGFPGVVDHDFGGCLTDNTSTCGGGGGGC